MTTAEGLRPQRVDLAAPPDTKAPRAVSTARHDAALYRNFTIFALIFVVMMPVGLIIYQSFLDGAFFLQEFETQPQRLSVHTDRPRFL